MLYVASIERIIRSIGTNLVRAPPSSRRVRDFVVYFAHHISAAAVASSSARSFPGIMMMMLYNGALGSRDRGASRRSSWTAWCELVPSQVWLCCQQRSGRDSPGCALEYCSAPAISASYILDLDPISLTLAALVICILCFVSCSLCPRVGSQGVIRQGVQGAIRRRTFSSWAFTASVAGVSSSAFFYGSCCSLM
jgi:hypothetical protein